MTHPASGNPTWQDYPDLSTPVTATSLESIENALDQIGATPFGHAGRTGGFQNASPAADPVGVASQVLSGGMTFASNGLVVPATKYYLITGCGYATGGTGYRFSVAFRKNDAGWTETPSAVSWKGSTDDHKSFATGVRFLTAGDRITLVVGTVGNSTYGTDGYNGSWFEVLGLNI